ncbi:MAG: glutamyl-tRNA reductase [Chthoniobacterales bacterium]
MNLFCVGISHHTADVDTRERYAAPKRDALMHRSGCSELLLLNTCNRVEVYAVAERPAATADIARWLADEEAQHEHDHTSFYRYEGDECVQHLFRVASGFDSMVVGETEILGQAKKAYEQARASGSAGRYLHRLFQRAFRVAKEVRTLTDITRGAVSVGSVAVELAGKIFGRLGDCRVLVLGAGETSERTARALVSRGVRDLRVSNRSYDRAEALAALVAGRAVPFSDWLSQCAEVDILITSTAAEEPLLTPAVLEPILRRRADRPLFIIDIAVPRDVAPEVNSLDGVYLYDIDSLRSIAEQSLALRKQQVAAGEEIIAEHVRDFRTRLTASLGGRTGAAYPPMGERSLRASEL